MEESNLKKYQHGQWGSILGQENDIRIAALKDEIELLWNGKSYDITNVSLPFQTIEHIEEPRQEKKVAQGNLFDKKQRDSYIH